MLTAEQRVVNLALEMTHGLIASYRATVQPIQEVFTDLAKAGQEVTGALQETAETINNGVGWQNPQEILTTTPNESSSDERLQAFQENIKFVEVDPKSLVALEAATATYGIVRALQFQGRALQPESEQKIETVNKQSRGMSKREFVVRSAGILGGVVLGTALVNHWDELENTLGLNDKNAATAAEKDIKSLNPDELRTELLINSNYALFGFNESDKGQVFGIFDKRNAVPYFVTVKGGEIKWYVPQINDEKKLGFVCGIDQNGKTRVIAIDEEGYRFGFNLGENPQAGFLSFYHLLENDRVQEVGHAYFVLNENGQSGFRELITDYPDVKINPDGFLSGPQDQIDKINKAIVQKTSTPTVTASPKPTPSAIPSPSATVTDKLKPTPIPTKKPAVGPSPSPTAEATRLFNDGSTFDKRFKAQADGWYQTTIPAGGYFFSDISQPGSKTAPRLNILSSKENLVDDKERFFMRVFAPKLFDQIKQGIFKNPTGAGEPRNVIEKDDKGNDKIVHYDRSADTGHGDEKEPWAMVIGNLTDYPVTVEFGYKNKGAKCTGNPNSWSINETLPGGSGPIVWKECTSENGKRD